MTSALCEPPDHALGHSRGGYSTKLQVVCDSNGVPLAAALRAGQRNERSFVLETLDEVAVPQPAAPPRRRPRALSGDKGYSAAWLRQWLRRHRITPVIPSRSDQPQQRSFDREQYRRRNIIERLIGWLKEYRRIATRFEKLGIMYLAMVNLAFISEYLNHYLSDTA